RTRPRPSRDPKAAPQRRATTPNSATHPKITLRVPPELTSRRYCTIRASVRSFPLLPEGRLDDVVFVDEDNPE
ncbi:MAG TPA: hypothetical protein VGO80_19215, partial [Solirubrobacteraceae bacterium]|nr:hypothetical protein [Solirubrobacteraceae bacterium]